MQDKKRIDAVVDRIANRGMASSHAPRPANIPRAILAAGVSMPPKAVGGQAGKSAFVVRMAAGKAKAKADRASSTAPPTPKKSKAQSGLKLNSVPQETATMPTPAASGGHVEIHFHNNK